MSAGAAVAPLSAPAALSPPPDTALSIALLSSSVALVIALSSAVRFTASLSRRPNWASTVEGWASSARAANASTGRYLMGIRTDIVSSTGEPVEPTGACDEGGKPGVAGRG